MGTALISSDSLLGDAVSDPYSDEDDSSEDNEDGSTASETDDDGFSSEVETDALVTSDAGTDTGAQDYFDVRLRPGKPALAESTWQHGDVRTAEPEGMASPSPQLPHDVTPSIRVELQEEPSASTSSVNLASIPPSRPASRRGLSIPGFVKRRFSSSATASRNTTQPGTPLGESDDGGMTDEPSTPGGGSLDVTTRRKRFSRKKRRGTTESELADALVEMSLTAGGVGLAAVPAEEQPTRKKRGGGKKRRNGEGKRKGRKRRSMAGYTFGGHDGIAGLVQIEITSAQDLPPYRNALRTGFDMDPFCVISFGRKVFRTRVIRHSLNPVWEERLFFHVGEEETHWSVLIRGPA